MDRIFGRMPVLEALNQEGKVDRVYILDSLSGAFEIEIRDLCQTQDIPLHRIPKYKLDREIKGNHQGIYAITSGISYVELEPILARAYAKRKPVLILLLDGIQDVRNMGAIARSAEIFGADAIVITGKKGAPVNEVAIKASAGALLHLPVCRVHSLHHIMDLFGKYSVEVMAADRKATTELSSLDLTVPLAIVLGAEGRGIDKNLKLYFDREFCIPQSGQTESLNVSVASGIILYEIYKQRH